MLELWCWRRLLRVPWTARRSNQSIVKEIKPEYSLEGLMLKLKLQYFGHLMQRANSLENTLMLGKIEGRRRRGRQRMRWWMASLTQWTWVWAGCWSWWWTGKPGIYIPFHSCALAHSVRGSFFFLSCSWLLSLSSLSLSSSSSPSSSHHPLPLLYSGHFLSTLHVSTLSSFS